MNTSKQRDVRFRRHGRNGRPKRKAAATLCLRTHSTPCRFQHDPVPAATLARVDRRVNATMFLRSSASVCRSHRVGPPAIAGRSTFALSSSAAVNETTAWRGGVTPNASRSSCLLGPTPGFEPRIDGAPERPCAPGRLRLAGRQLGAVDCVRKARSSSHRRAAAAQGARCILAGGSRKRSPEAVDVFLTA